MPGPRITTLLALLAGGVLLGLVGAVVVSARITIGSLDVPWGLALAVVAVGCCVRAAAWYVGTRRGAVVVLLGWVLASLAFSAVNPGGDVVLPDTSASYVYLGASVVLGLVACLWPLPEGAAAAAHPPRLDPDDDLDDDPDHEPDGEPDDVVDDPQASADAPGVGSDVEASTD